MKEKKTPDEAKSNTGGDIGVSNMGASDALLT
jgi:hypothetical protein